MTRTLNHADFAAALSSSRFVPFVETDRLDAIISACEHLTDEELRRVAEVADPAARLRYLGAVATARGVHMDLLRLA